MIQNQIKNHLIFHSELIKHASEVSANCKEKEASKEEAISQKYYSLCTFCQYTSPTCVESKVHLIDTLRQRVQSVSFLPPGLCYDTEKR